MEADFTQHWFLSQFIRLMYVLLVKSFIFNAGKIHIEKLDTLSGVFVEQPATWLILNKKMNFYPIEL